MDIEPRRISRPESDRNHHHLKCCGGELSKLEVAQKTYRSSIYIAKRFDKRNISSIVEYVGEGQTAETELSVDII